MKESLGNFRERCMEAALGLLWRQWSSLGVAGHASPADPGRIIDPEALLLATTRLGWHDPRLFDECLDWLSSYSGLFHLQRLRTLNATTQLGDVAVLSAMADWLVQCGGQPKWKAHVPTDISYFDSHPDFEGPPPRTPDPVFKSHGLLRPLVQTRGMSRPPNPSLSPNLLLALRALIGVSARAEVILCLATGPAAHPAEIARLIGYKPRTMQVLLQEMSLSGHVLSSEPPQRHSGKAGRGNTRRYHVKEADWRFLTGGRPLPRWTPWAPLWSLVCAVIDALPASGQAEPNPVVVSSKIRDRLASDGPALAAAGLLPLLDVRSGALGEELIESLADSLPELLGTL